MSDDKPEVPAMPTLAEAQKALVMFVSELTKDDTGAVPAATKERATIVLSDWLMAGIIEVARRASGGGQ